MEHVKNFQDFLNEGMWSKSALAAMSRVPMNARYFLTDEDGNVLEQNLKTMSSVVAALNAAAKEARGGFVKQAFSRQVYGKIPEVVNVHDMKNGGKAVEQWYWDPERKQHDTRFGVNHTINMSKVPNQFFLKGEPVTFTYDTTKQKAPRHQHGDMRTNEALSMDAVYIHQIIGSGQDVIQDFIDDNQIDGKKLADYVKMHKDSKEKYDVRDMIRGVGVGASKTLRSKFISKFR